MAIKALEQQLSEDCVSKQIVIDVLKHKWNILSDANDAMQESIDTIKTLPPATPTRKTGQWVSKGDVYPAWKYCSNCKEPWTFNCGTPNFCPNCGAKIAESEDKE